MGCFYKNVLLQIRRIFIFVLLFSTWNTCMGMRIQKFAMEPKNQTAIVGSEIILPCRVINKTGSVQWTKNGFGLGTERNLSISGFNRYSMIGTDEEGDYSLKINPVMLKDEATYECQVFYGHLNQPGIRSNPAYITVLVPPDPPKIFQGDYVIATEERETELKCLSYGGKPASEITWLDASGNVFTNKLKLVVDPLPDGRFMSISTLKFIPKKYHHNTTFACQAQNIAEVTPQLAKFQLEIKYAPRVTVSAFYDVATNNRIPEGSEVRFKCNVDANPLDVTYKWYINDELIIKDYTSEFIINNISRKYNDATIKCEVHNEVGKSEDSKTLDISYAPYFKTKPKSIQADLGSNVTLTCDIDGDPLPEITWIHKDTNRVLGTEPNLTITVDNINYFFGQYYCKASATGFPEIEGEATIYLKGRPSINSHHTQFGHLGDKVRVDCTAISIPLADNVTWTFNGTTINEGNEDYTILEKAFLEGIKSTLIIHKSEERHFGNYNCTISNHYGSDTLVINLKPQINSLEILKPLLIFGGIISCVGTTIMFLLYQRNKRKQIRKRKLSEINVQG